MLGEQAKQVPHGEWRGTLGDSMRYWEARRVLFNAALFAVVMVWLVATWPHFRPALRLVSLLPMGALALLANACYCAAYLVDIPMQRSAVGDVWRRRRWGFWLVGTVFAVVLANYWIADEIYPDVR